MYVVEYGPPDGEPIVFLHGSMVAGWMWVEQAEGLSEYRCLVPDLPGMGQSGDETWRNFASTADEVADLIKARCTGESAHVVGLSLGGIIGVNLAARDPDTVRSLLVSGVPAGTIPAAWRVVNKMMLFLYQRSWGARLIGKSFGLPDKESMAAFVETARLTDGAALANIVREVSIAPLPENLGAVEARTLAVVGSEDTKPAHRGVVSLRDQIPNARAYIVPGVGHQWNAEEPELFTEMVRLWISDQKTETSFLPM